MHLPTLAGTVTRGGIRIVKHPEPTTRSWTTMTANEITASIQASIEAWRR